MVTLEYSESLSRIRAVLARPSIKKNIWDVLSPRQRMRCDIAEAEMFRYPHGMIRAWMESRKVSEERALLELWCAIGQLPQAIARRLLRHVADPPSDLVDDPEAAIDEGYLVLFDYSPFAAFWHHSLIEIDWTTMGAQWVYFSTLCKAAKRRDWVDNSTFRKSGTRYPAQCKHRLAGLGLPIDLDDRIIPAGSGIQRLDVPSSQIHIYQFYPDFI